MIYGIDISSFQGEINFDELVKSTINGQPIKFVIIRATEGVGFIDPEWERNRNEARRVGLLRMFMHFAHPDLGNSGTSEASFYMNNIPNFHEDEGCALDWEIETDVDIGNWSKDFFDRIRTTSNELNGLFYSRQGLMQGKNLAQIYKNNNGLWICEPNNDPNNVSFTGDFSFAAIKQFAIDVPVEQTQILGIAHGQGIKVDLDVFYGDENQFKAYGFHAPKPITPVPPTQPEPVVVMHNFTIKVNDKIVYTTQIKDDATVVLNTTIKNALPADNIQMFDNNILIFNSPPMPVTPGDSLQSPTTVSTNTTASIIPSTITAPNLPTLDSLNNSIGDHLSTAAGYSSISTFIAFNIGILIAYANPSAPIYVLLAIMGLLTIAINILLAIGKRLGDFLSKRFGL